MLGFCCVSVIYEKNFNLLVADATKPSKCIKLLVSILNKNTRLSSYLAPLTEIVLTYVPTVVRTVYVLCNIHKMYRQLLACGGTGMDTTVPTNTLRVLNIIGTVMDSVSVYRYWFIRGNKRIYIQDR